MNDFWNFPHVRATPESARIPEDTLLCGERSVLQCPVRISIVSYHVRLSAHHDRTLAALFSAFECAATMFFHYLATTSNQEILDQLLLRANVGVLIGAKTPLGRLNTQSMTLAMQEQRLLFVRPIGPLCDTEDVQSVAAALSTIVVLLDVPDAHPALIQGWEALRMNHAVWIPDMVFAIPGLSWPQRMLSQGAVRVSDTFTARAG